MKYILLIGVVVLLVTQLGTLGLILSGIFLAPIFWKWGNIWADASVHVANKIIPDNKKK